jgi:predicted nucleotidyltransferase
MMQDRNNHQLRNQGLGQDIEAKIHAKFPLLGECVRQLVEKLHPLQVILFGSYAKGLERPDSDLDFLLVLDQGFNPNSTRMQAIRQARQILKPVHCPKDVLVFNDSEVSQWKESLNHIIGQAFHEGWTLYERP